MEIGFVGFCMAALFACLSSYLWGEIQELRERVFNLGESLKETNDIIIKSNAEFIKSVNHQNEMSATDLEWKRIFSQRLDAMK